MNNWLHGSYLLGGVNPWYCPRADSGSLIRICSERDAAPESTADVQEITNKSFLIVEVSSVTQKYIRGLESVRSVCYPSNSWKKQPTMS